MDRLTSIEQLTFEPRGRVHPSPRDWRNQVVYQLMIDRFDDNQDHPPYDPATARPRENDPKEGRKFQGGNLKGITRRLGYLQSLGITTLWISPPLKNRKCDPQSYHGYGAQDFLSVDPRFGTLADLRELADALHDRGMYLVMDIVVDHAGDVWAYENDTKPVFTEGRPFPFGFWRAGDHNGPAAKTPGPDDAVWPIELQHPDAFLRKGRMGQIADTKGDELTDGDFQDLKCFDLSKPEVMNALTAIYKYWIAAVDVDGFCIDAARHMRPNDLQNFTNAIREFAVRIGKYNFVQVGELAHGGKETQRFIGSNTPLRNEEATAEHPFLDATLDFDLFKAAGKVFAGLESPAILRDRWLQLETYHRDAALATRDYWTFVENHDMGARDVRRLLANVPPDQAVAYALRSMAFLLFGPGVPILYYGTEQGFNGDGHAKPCMLPDGNNEVSPGDHCIREAMFGGTWGGLLSQGAHFFNPKHPIYAGIRKLIELRTAIPCLRFGRTVPRDTTPGILAFGRSLDNQDATVAINLTHLPYTGYIPTPEKGNLHTLIHPKPIERTPFGAHLTLPPLGFEVILNDL